MSRHRLPFLRRPQDRRSVLQGAAALAAGAALASPAGRVLGQESGGDFTREAAIVSWGFGTENTLSAARVDAFREAYPNIQLEVVPQFEDQQLLTAAASGELPDVLWVDRFKISSYASRNILLALDDLVAQSALDLSQWCEAAITEATYNGAL